MEDTSSKKIRASLSLDKEMYEAGKSIAYSDRRSFSSYVEGLIIKDIKKKREDVSSEKENKKGTTK